MCPNIWVQCLKLKQEDKRHNLKIIIFRRPHLLFGYRYKILDSRSHSCTTIICSEEKNKTDVNVYVGSTRDLDDKFLLLHFSISSTQNVKTYVQTHILTLTLFLSGFLFVMCNVHFERYYFCIIFHHRRNSDKHEWIKSFQLILRLQRVHFLLQIGSLYPRKYLSTLH